MASVRVSSRSTKGKRGVRVTAFEPFLVSTGVSPVPKKKRGGKRSVKSVIAAKDDSSAPADDDSLAFPSGQEDSLVIPSTDVDFAPTVTGCAVGADMYQHEFGSLFDLLPPSPVSEREINDFFTVPDVRGTSPVTTVGPSVNLESGNLVCGTVECGNVESVNAGFSDSSDLESDRVLAVPVVDQQPPVRSTSSQACTSSQSSQSRFLPLDPTLVNRVKELKRGKSFKNNNWAINRLNAWRSEVGKELTPIDKMPYEELSGVLLEFFLCICKDSGERYPSGSLRNFHKSFNRILRDAQRLRISQTKVNEEPFSIETNPYFVEVNSAVVAAMEKSRDAGANKQRRKPKCLSFAEEALILGHASQSLSSNVGVLKRILWFNTSQFMIRGNTEMYKLRFKDFTQGIDDHGRCYVEYNERTSKAYAVALNRCQDEDFRPPVRVYHPAVVETWRVYSLHLADDMKEGNLFLSPIQPHPISSQVWYKHTNVGEKKLRQWLNHMAREAGIAGDVTNKSGRRTGITRMALKDTPRDVMCQITGHKSASSLDRYDDTLLLKREAALKAIATDSETGDYHQIKKQLFKELSNGGSGSTYSHSNSLAVVPYLSELPSPQITDARLFADFQIPPIRNSVSQSLFTPGQFSSPLQCLPCNAFSAMHSSAVDCAVEAVPSLGHQAVPSLGHQAVPNFGHQAVPNFGHQTGPNLGHQSGPNQHQAGRYAGPNLGSTCSFSCEIHCPRQFYQDKNLDPLRPVRNSVGPQPFVRPVYKSVPKKIPAQFARSPGQILRDVEFLPSGNDRFMYRPEHGSTSTSNVSETSRSVPDAYDGELDQIILDYDLELFERGKIVRAGREQVKEKESDADSGLGAVVKPYTSAVQQQPKLQVQQQPELQVQQQPEVQVQPQVHRSQVAAAPFSNVSQFIQINNTMDLNLEKIMRGFFNPNNQN
ncbi:hypothetical protein KC19_6G162600 [Ceratodon purpureus]|uniref:DUF3504 domain-containing protein n=1 Tax=Ceratodon purpureus TaxID=3225 RepID=A0A8T0HHT2_CERPU|nr:hypothetical protein KC19_6G162600 [Ceratodon purpureus]